MKKICLFCLLALLLSFSLMLVGCDGGEGATSQGGGDGDNADATCTHEWESASCIKPKTCKLCKETEGNALGHTWEDADCETPKTCSVCEETKGAALGHSWISATCTTPKTCFVCNATEGVALSHTWIAATCVASKTCSACGSTEGEALGHSWKDATCTSPKTCAKCDATSGTKLSHDYQQGVCTYCNAPDPDYVPTYTFGDTFEFLSVGGKMQITIGNNYTFTCVDNEYSEHYMKTAIRIPVTVRNIDTTTGNLNMFDVKPYDSNGNAASEAKSYYCLEVGDGRDAYQELRPGASVTGAIYIFYSGNGDYYITFKNVLSSPIDVKLPITK